MSAKGRPQSYRGKSHMKGLESPDDLSDKDSLLDLGPTAPPPEDPNVLTVGIIADTEVTLGFLLAGIGFRRDNQNSYLMVESDMPQEEIESFFEQLYRMHNLGIIILDFPTHKRLKSVLDKCKNMLPVVVVVPNKATLGPYQEWKGRKHIREQDM
ncbi:uncharacterized protein [Drosophila pseudoobscura]|uniref:V-type proton ATPase subunit F n=1 Tax=Drosophila pseudoobscura pseudoobscura TaxID=46245 RepID=Q29CQ6_DROPS|nr:uncharacterized protein LOC4811755 [Drosophila pseudoobscura]